MGYQNRTLGKNELAVVNFLKRVFYRTPLGDDFDSEKVLFNKEKSVVWLRANNSPEASMSIYIFYHVFYLVFYPLLIYVHANSVKFFNLHM